MSIILQGSTSGSVTLQEPAVAGTTVLTLPAVTGTVLTTTSPKAGNVLQVVNATTSTQASTTSGTFQDTGLSATITPSSSSSKILVIWAINGTFSASGVGIETNLVRTSTQIVYTENIAARDGSGNDAGSGTSGGTYLDSPATTSAITYKCQYRSRNGSGTVYVQETGGAGASVASTSMMTLMEIAG